MFGRMLALVVELFGWRCHTYCLMPNHYHLLLETPEPNLSAGMQRLNSNFAQWFNAEHGFSGHVFERRFFSRVVESTYDLFELSRYVVLNPVRAGLCEAPGNWEWSSYRALVGDARPASFLTTERLLSQFAHETHRAREIFRTFVDDARPRAHSA
jgi:putative transposase